ncbi:MAG: FAD-dependent thymidylate synthase [Oscillospiraceae bacterium]
MALRKPEVYRRTPDWTPQAAQPLVPDEPVTVLCAAQDAGRKICDAYPLARGLAPQPLREDEQTELLKTLLARPRRRELEQASYTLLFGGLSLAALTHLTRHRMQSLCPQLLQNIRYDRYVLPQSVRDKGMEARYRSAVELAGQAAAQLRDRGADESALCYLMLSGQTVPVLTTMNAGELYIFFRLRCCMRAQWEDPRRRLSGPRRPARGLAGVVPPLWYDLLLHRQMPRRQNDLRSPGRNEAEIQRIKRTARRNGWPNKTDNRHSGIIRCARSCII